MRQNSMPPSLETRRRNFSGPSPTPFTHTRNRVVALSRFRDGRKDLDCDGRPVDAFPASFLDWFHERLLHRNVLANRDSSNQRETTDPLRRVDDSTQIFMVPAAYACSYCRPTLSPEIHLTRLGSSGLANRRVSASAVACHFDRPAYF